MAFYCDYIFPLLNGRSDPSSVRKARRSLVGTAEGDVLEIGFEPGKTLPYYSGAGLYQVPKPLYAALRPLYLASSFRKVDAQGLKLPTRQREYLVAPYGPRTNRALADSISF